MLTPGEVLKLAPLAMQLADALRDGFAPDGPRGRSLSRRELRRIGLLSLRLAARLLVDVVD